MSSGSFSKIKSNIPFQTAQIGKTNILENSPIVHASNQGIKGFSINLIACLYPDVVKSPYRRMPVWQRHKIGGGEKKNLWRWISNAFLPRKDIHQELNLIRINLSKL
jgi:hypothetical protein